MDGEPGDIDIIDWSQMGDDIETGFEQQYEELVEHVVEQAEEAIDFYIPEG